MPTFVDTHCHLDAPEFGAEAADVRRRAREAGVVHCIIPAVQANAFDVVRTLAHEGGDSYALGIHPLFTPQAREDDLARLDDALRRHMDDARLVAVGEIGLDHFVPGVDRQRQEKFYREQLQLARRHGLPVVLHVRRSADTLLRHLREVRVSGGIAHAFNGSEQQAGEFIKLGFMLGFGGAVTYDRALQLRRLAAGLPLSALVLETDAPDIPPKWLYRTAAERGAGAPQGRNEPAELPKIAQSIAALRGTGVEDLARATTDNAAQALPRLAPLLRG